MNRLSGKILQLINSRDGLSFAEFMELALYEPEDGYYEKQREIGRSGDFYTSVSVSQLFGELLAFQFSRWLEEIPPPWRLVEAGAHAGQLGKDILAWLRAYRPEQFERLRYAIIENSSRRRGWQAETLREFANQVEWLEDVSALETKSVRGIIFSNEFFDAFPVHRAGWDAQQKQWFEWVVGGRGEQFVWAKRDWPAELPKPKLPIELEPFLPEGFTTEVQLAAPGWWKTAAGALRTGKLLTIDYGLLDEEFFRPERADGTLRGFLRHHLMTDLLSHVGEQDLTAHVNFSALIESGEEAGLRTEAFLSQEKFLTQIAAAHWSDNNPPTPREAAAFRSLAHPDQLGGRFKVLIQRTP